MFIVRVVALLLIAMGVMVLGYDALTALQSGTIAPISAGGLVSITTNQAGWTEGLDLEGLRAMAEGWPGYFTTPYGILIELPAFAVFGGLGVLMALVFRGR
jgi:hypothetical protein